jgi:copper homeostasis protein
MEQTGGLGLDREIIFELCAESLEACHAAHEGGADRIELCSALSEGGLTPSHSLIHAAVTQSGLPVYVILCPRSGDYVYSAAEFRLMQDDLERAQALGASGFVAGILRPDGSVDRGRMEQLVKQAAPLEITFHRAFDVAANLELALEDAIATGCRRLLTSGGATSVYDGAEEIRRLVEQACERIEIAVGGGLRHETAAEVARITQAKHFHGSVRHWQPGYGCDLDGVPMGQLVTSPADVRTMITALRTIPSESEHT